MRTLAKRAAGTPSSATVRIADLATEMRRNGISVLDFSAGRAAEHSPDYINEAASKALLSGDTHQTPAQGTFQYRSMVARKLERENNIIADPQKNIMATMGCKNGLTLALMATINPGDEVIVEDPCFVSYFATIGFVGGKVVPVPIRPANNFRWDRNELENGITDRTRVILYCSPQNPTGTVHTEEDLDMDRLVAYASENDLLDHVLIWDGTRSRGGSKGAYAIQKLSPKPFKTTFGNVRISDITEAFIQKKQEDFAERKIEDAGVKETIDDDTWLMEWLETDVMAAISNGDVYSNNVPFKSAHLPKDSDGILQPAEVHFRGPLVCLFGPHGGSHLDQFAAMVVDNKLGYTIGMPTGGYSNTWEWEEDLHFPISGKPVARFMWSMGHTIRPNGEILEGNAAEVDEYVPVTRENYLSYYELLLKKAFEYLESDQ